MTIGQSIKVDKMFQQCSIKVDKMFQQCMNGRPGQCLTDQMAS